MNTYLCYSKDKNAQLFSSSGGVFYEMAKYIIDTGGIVYGCQIDSKGHVFHSRANTLEQLISLIGSKYVMSNISGVVNLIKKDLINNKKVLFVGTPCQVFAVNKLFNEKHSHQLLLVDIICHGCVKPQYWKDYLDSLPYKMPYDISFRDKTYSWERFSMRINGEVEEHKQNIYFKYFLDNYSLMDQCYSCGFKGENRFSDATIGDAWGAGDYAPEFVSKNGTSLLFVRNNKSGFFDHLKNCCEIQQVNYLIPTLIYNKAYYKSYDKPDDYELVKKRLDDKTAWDNTIINTNNQNLFIRLFKYFKHHVFEYIRWNSGIIKNNKRTNDVGVVTDDRYNNFGNRLQNYALLTILRKNGFKVANICSNDESNKLYVKYNVANKNREGKRAWSICKTSLKYEGKHYLAFFDRNFNHINVKNILIGSDQVWNYEYQRENLALKLGSIFAKDGYNIVSYATSIGHTRIDKRFEGFFQNELKNFNHISVREYSAKQLIEKMGYDPTLDLDPTLLLTKEEWLSAIKRYSKIKIPNYKYTLLYKLENADNDICNEKTINLFDRKSNYFNINQFDFLSLILNSNKVITDSYHCVIFCKVFDKEYVLVNRNKEKMTTRFDSLFQIKFNNLENLRDESINNLINSLRR